MPARSPAVRIRWWIFAFMFLVGFVAYLQQKTLTIAATPMEPALSLSDLQTGWLRAAFIAGYAACQLPAGLVGEHFGARRTLVYAGLLSIAAMLAMPAAPTLLHGDALFVAMLLAQLLLGVSQSVVWPVSAGVISRWFPSTQWPFVLGLQTMSLSIASMVTPPLTSHLMVSHGWQCAFVIATLPAIPLAILWGWFGRNTPREHARVTAAEIAELDAPAADRAGTHDGSSVLRRAARQLGNPQILLLAFSYFCMNYVFYLVGDWCFKYLAEERHMPLLDSGWLAMAPPAGAALGAGVGGIITTALCVRLGRRRGSRLLPLLSLPAAGVLLLLTVWSSTPYLAVLCLSVCFAAIELNEGVYWAATMAAGGEETMVATGILNTGGNLGGVVTAPIVGYLAGLHQWNTAFLIGVAFAGLSAAAWLFIDGEPRRSATAAG